MIYLPCGNTQNADLISRGMWQMLKPDVGSDTTTHYCGWISHPDTQDTWIEIEETDLVPVHVYARTDLLEGVLAGFIQAGMLSVGAVEWIQNQVDNYRGQTATISNFIHPDFMAMAKSKAQLEAMGFFPATNIHEGEE